MLCMHLCVPFSLLATEARVRSNRKTKNFLKLKWTGSARRGMRLTLKTSTNAMCTTDLKHVKILMLNNDSTKEQIAGC
jgi:hypothetical protein